MRHRNIIVGSLVLVVSFGAAYFLPISEVFRGVVAIPGALALVATLLQLMRDEAAYAKQISLKNSEHMFSLGAMSHMANTAFDKHAEFCTTYMDEIHTTVTTLFREGPTVEALRHAQKLYNVRREYAAWITNDISRELEPFEKALRGLGAAKGYLKDTQGHEDPAQNRQDWVKKAWSHFDKITDLNEVPEDETVAAEAIKNQVRDIIGINELVKIRKEVIKRAIKAIEAD